MKVYHRKYQFAKKIHSVCLKTIVLIFPLFVSAQEGVFFENISLSEGLSQSTVNCVVQDSLGFIWLGTEDGLNRYDGRSIKTFNYIPFDKASLSGDRIVNVIPGSKNHILVFSIKGIDCFNISAEKALRYDLGKLFKSDNISILAARLVAHDIYISTNKGLYRFDGKSTATATVFYSGEDQLHDIKTYSICENEGVIYVATNEGIFYSNDRNNFYELKIGMSRSTNIRYFKDGLFQLVSNNEYLFFNIKHKLYAYKIKAKQLTDSLLMTPSITNHITAIMIQEQSLWIGCNEDGLSRAQLLNGKFRKGNSPYANSIPKFALSSSNIKTISKSQGIVWIGTENAGVFKYNYFNNLFFTYSNPQANPQKMFLAIVKDSSGIVWAGTSNGILKIDRTKNNYSFIDLTELTGIAQKPIESMYIDKNDTIWVGLNNILYQVDKTKLALKKITTLLDNETFNPVFKIKETSDGLLYLATFNGPVFFDKKKRKTSTKAGSIFAGRPILGQKVGSILIDSENKLWCGANKGLTIFTQHGRKIFTNNIADTNSLPSNSVLEVFQTKDQEIFVATPKGLSKCLDSERGIFKNYIHQPGMTNNFIYGIAEDENGSLWLTTNNGLTCFNRKQNTFTTYHSYNGTGIDEYNSGGYFRSTDGELFFCGINGFTSIYPQTLNSVKLPTPVVYFKKLANMEGAAYVDFLDLGKLNSDNHASIELVTPYYCGKLTLYYQYAGLDSGWNLFPNSTLFNLKKLAPGSYDIRFKAVNEQGIGSTLVNAVFIIKTPFWKSLWFYLGSLSLLLLMTLLVQRRMTILKIKRIQEIEQIKKEENEKTRAIAALDLHDEFGNGLTRISMLVESAKMKNQNPELSRLLQSISENSNRLYLGTKDFIWSINPGNNNLYDVVLRTKDFVNEMFEDSSINFDLMGLNEAFRNISFSPSVNRNYMLIIKEAVANIAKHSKAKKASLTFSVQNGQLYTMIADDGIGLESGNKPNSFGMSNMKYRAGRSGIGISIEGKKNFGTTITLKLKIQ